MLTGDGLLDLLPAGVLVLDENDVVRKANPAAAELLCVSGELSGKRMPEILGNAYTQVEWAFAAATRTGDSKNATCLLKTDDAIVRLVSLVVQPVDRDDSFVTVVTVDDISRPYQSLVKRSQADKMAAVGLLAAGIAHEFNNIWASVQGYAELAQQNPKFTEPLVHVCLEQSERAAEIIHAMLSFSNLRVGMRPGVKVRTLVEAIRRLVEMELRTRGVDLVLQFDDEPQVTGNESMLQQVLLNLVVNAYQAVGENGTVTVRVGCEEPFAVISVRDTGPGLTPDQIARLYEPFYTTKGALGGNELEDGTGLGLTLCHNLVRLHRGTMDVRSHPGDGSEFIVRLPLSGASEVVASVPEEKPVQTDNSPASNVLVVEGETILRDLISGMLAGLKVFAVVSAEDAIEHVKRAGCDVILLDEDLAGDLSARAFLALLKEIENAPPVVLLSGQAEGGMKDGSSLRVVRKPFAQQELIDAIVSVSRS